jgi:hypothetical protein
VETGREALIRTGMGLSSLASSTYPSIHALLVGKGSVSLVESWEVYLIIGAANDPRWSSIQPEIPSVPRRVTQYRGRGRPRL